MCIASLKSMTIAIKAKRALNEAYMTKKGCAYGIKFDCMNIYSVENILNNKRVKYTEIFRI